MVSVPIVGHVACGKPVWAESDLVSYARIDQRFTGANTNEIFLLRADRDSMSQVRPTAIEDGNLLLVRHQADAGEIVVARNNGETTVKVYRSATGIGCQL